MLLQKIKSDPCNFIEKEEIGLGKFDKFELDDDDDNNNIVFFPKQVGVG